MICSRGLSEITLEVLLIYFKSDFGLNCCLCALCLQLFSVALILNR